RLEGFGLSIVEGWVHERAALVSRGAGVAELVRDGENGFTFAPDDDAALARHMLALASDADLAARLGREGRRTAQECSLARGSAHIWKILDDLSARKTWE
ncbi:MAG: glycosyltransferase, partial [Thermoplasmatota archaeon]